MLELIGYPLWVCKKCIILDIDQDLMEGGKLWIHAGVFDRLWIGDFLGKMNGLINKIRKFGNQKDQNFYKKVLKLEKLVIQSIKVRKVGNQKYLNFSIFI